LPGIEILGARIVSDVNNVSHTRLIRDCIDVGSAVVVMRRRAGVVMLMPVFVCTHRRNRRHTVMSWSARRFGDSGGGLQGQRNDQNPKQECLEGAIHFFSLAQGTGSKYVSKCKPSHRKKVKRNVFALQMITYAKLFQQGVLPQTGHLVRQGNTTRLGRFCVQGLQRR